MLERLGQQLSPYLHCYCDDQAAALVVPSAHAVCPVWDGHAGFSFLYSHLKRLHDVHSAPAGHAVIARLFHAILLTIYNPPDTFIRVVCPYAQTSLLWNGE